MPCRNSGQSMVEMALVLPFLVLILLGIGEGGYYVYTYSELENATRRASERASKTPPLSPADPNASSDKCMKLAEAAAIDGVFLSDLQASNITFAYPDGGERVRGDQIEVTVKYTGNFLTPVGSRLFSDKITFDFVSRRTITDIDAPRGFKPDCSPA